MKKGKNIKRNIIVLLLLIIIVGILLWIYVEHIMSKKIDFETKEKVQSQIVKDEFCWGDIFSGESEMVIGNSGNMINEGYVYETEKHVFWCSGNKIYKEEINGNGENKQLIVEELEQCRELCAFEEYIYYICGARIKKVGINGGQPVEITEEPAVYMQVTNKKIYFVGYGVFSMDLDGSELILLTKAGMVDEKNPDLCWVNIYNEFVCYVSPSEHETLYAVKKDGTEVYKLAEHVRYPVVEGDCVYFQWKEKEIRELSFLTGDERTVIPIYRARLVFYDDIMYRTDFRGLYYSEGLIGEEIRVFPVDVYDFEKEMNDYFVDLFWVTSNRIYFMGISPERQNYNELKYVDRMSGEIGIIN